MSKNDMVMVPRELLERLKNASSYLGTHIEASEGIKTSHYANADAAREILAKPTQQHQGEPLGWVRPQALEALKDVGWVHVFAAKGGDDSAVAVYTHADPAEVERLREELDGYKQGSRIEAEEADTLRAQLAEAQALLREWCRMFAGGHPASAQVALRTRSEAALSASAEPSAPKCKGWTCFHCDENFTDREAAAIHFGTHEIQRPACLIDAAEYRSMEERVRECANEDSELHRQIHRKANEHKLELQRAEEGGYAKGLADASAPVEIDERVEFEKWWSATMNTQEMDLHRHIYPMNRGWAYACHETNRSWMTWQARAALARKP